MVVKTTFVADLFVPEPLRCGHAGYRERLQRGGAVMQQKSPTIR
jgi:hypothetical protein